VPGVGVAAEEDGHGDSFQVPATFCQWSSPEFAALWWSRYLRHHFASL